jgi:HK97 family phage major capsid protein
MNVIEMRQKRSGLVAEARALVDKADAEKRELTIEENSQYDALMTEVDKLREEIERRERLEGLEKQMEQSSGRVVKEEGTLTPALSQGERGKGRDSAEYRKAFESFLRSGSGVLSEREMRALQSDNDELGGYLVTPQQMVNDLIKAVDNMVYIRQWATKFSVPSAQSLGVPSLDADPADPTWTSEILTGTEDSTMDFGKRELFPRPLAKLIKVSKKLLRQVPSVEGLVNQRLAYKFAVVEESAFMTGTGAGQPLGVFTASDMGISTGRDVSTGNTTTAITFDGLTEAKYTLKQQYWAKAKWLYHRDVLKTIAKIKDGEGQYVWRESVRAGEPDTLLNAPVFMTEYAPSTMTTQLYVGILGDFSYYWIADALSMEIQRLVELYAATNQVGFIGRLEVDAMPVLEEAFVRVKLA